MGTHEQDGLWPGPIRKLIDALAHLTIRCDAVCRAQARLDRAKGVATALKLPRSKYFEEPGLPQGIVDEAGLARHCDARRKRRLRADRLVLNLHDSSDGFALAFRRWRAAIEAARPLVAEVSPWMDTPGLAIADNWCAGLLGELSQLGGLAIPDVVGEAPDSIDLDELRRFNALLGRRLSKLKGVPNIAPPTPGGLSPRAGGPARPLLRDLLQAVDGIAGVAVIRRVRRAAGMDTSPRGRRARLYRYAADDVDRMIDAVLDGPFNRKGEIVDAWACWGTRGGYRAILAAREATR